MAPNPPDITNRQLLDEFSKMLTKQFDALVDAIADMFAYQAEQMATKDDLKNHPTKEDLRDITTKLASKDDIARLEGKFERMRKGLAQAAKPI